MITTPPVSGEPGQAPPNVASAERTRDAIERCTPRLSFISWTHTIGSTGREL
jgi:hypothetical protein